MKYVRNNQAGFSLVELMVVVAIIGILASLAIPSIGKYMAKARQSEAKTQLSSLYTAEKAFYAEYTAYDARFGAVGYSPEGRLRYNVGFATNAGAAIAGVGNGYNFPAAASAAQSTGAPGNYCGAAAGVVQNNCSPLLGARNALPAAIAGTSIVNNVAAPATFVAEARANIHNSTANEDIWQMDQNKMMNNTQTGIP